MEFFSVKEMVVGIFRQPDFRRFFAKGKMPKSRI